MRLFRAWESFWGYFGFLRRNRRQRKAALARRRDLRRRHRMDSLEQRVVLNADAVDDDFSLDPEPEFVFSASQLTTNDSYNGTPTVTLPGMTSTGGTLQDLGDGTFRYVPVAGFSGVDSFSYSLNDDDGTPDVAAATIHVPDAPPEAPNVSFSVDERTVLYGAAGDLSAYAVDANGNTPTVVAGSTGLDFGGYLQINADGSFTYDPGTRPSGETSFDFQITDGTNAIWRTATIMINEMYAEDPPQNQPPVGQDRFYSVEEYQTLEIDGGAGLLLGASDPEGDSLSASGSGSTSANGFNYYVNADGSFTYNAGSSGSDYFEFYVCDGSATSGPYRAYITINAYVPPAENGAPSSPDRNFTIGEGQTLTGDANSPDSLLYYATDPDGDVPTASGSGTSANGNYFNVNADGSFTYYAGAWGSDYFDYQISDGTNTVTVRANITINEIWNGNDAPYTAGITSAMIDEDTSLAMSAGDPNGDGLTLCIVTPPSSGTLSMDGNTVLYQPNADFYGTDSFSYYVSDGSLTSDTDTVVVTVNSVSDAPVALDDEYDVDEDGSLEVVAPGVLSNDLDGDGDGLTASVVTAPQFAQEFALNADGSFLYRPVSDWFGTDTFQYAAASIDGTTAPVTVTIHVAPRNDAPTADIAAPNYYVNEQEPLALQNTGLQIGDVDGGQLAATATLTVDYGVLTADVGNLPGVTLSGSGSSVLTLQGSVDDINLLLTGNDGAWISYVADGDNPPSQSTLTLTVNDLANGGPGELTASATATIMILGVNDPVVAHDDVIAAALNTAVSFTAQYLLDNDVDPDSQPQVESLYGHASHGSVTWHANGSFTYTPDANFIGVDSFRYIASDGEFQSMATVWVEVGPLVVVAASNSATLATNEDTALGLRLTRNRVEGEYASVFQLQVAGGTLSAAGQPAATIIVVPAFGTFTYTPAANANGPVVLTIVPGTMSGGQFVANAHGTQTRTIQVAPVNDAPTAASDTFAIAEDGVLNTAVPGVLGNDADVDGTQPTAQLVSGPTHAKTFTLNPNGSFTYAPVDNWNGVDTFTYRASDGTLVSGLATVTISVPAVNDAPTLTVPSQEQLTSTSSTVVFHSANGNAVTVGDVEAGNKLLTLSVNHGTVALVGGTASNLMNFTGTVAQINAALDGLRYLAADNYAGPVQLSIAVNDQDATGGGALSATANIALRVQPRITVADASGVEGSAEGKVRFTVNLTAPYDQPVTVDYQTMPSSASGADFVAQNGTLTFAAGTTTQYVDITISDDQTAEYTEGFLLAFSGATNAVIATPTANGFITDDDLDPTASVVSTEVSETTGWATVTVRLSHSSEKEVSVHWNLSDGGAVTPYDYGSTYAPGYEYPYSYTTYYMTKSWTENVTRYDVNGYDLYGPQSGYWVSSYYDGEGTEIWYPQAQFVAASTPDGSWASYYADTISVVVGYQNSFSTYNGPDSAWINGYSTSPEPRTYTDYVTTSEPWIYESQGYSTTYWYTYSGTTTVPESWNPTGDLAGNLSFGAGEIEKTFQFAIADDLQPESDETVNVTLSPLANVLTDGSSSGTVTIVDNETPQPPRAHDKTYDLVEDVPFNVDSNNGVLAGAWDPNGQGLWVGMNSGPSNGTVTLDTWTGAFACRRRQSSARRNRSRILAAR